MKHAPNINTKIDSVLLVDDDYATNYLHQIFLEESQIVDNILVAKGADEALDILKTKLSTNQSPALIFLDINLPAKNGWEFLDDYKDLLQNSANESVVVMLSNSENPRDIEKAKDYHLVKDFRLKPLSVELIKELVDKHIHSSPQ